jgi:hypothetical protein
MGLLEILATESWNPSMLYANVMRLSGGSSEHFMGDISAEHFHRLRIPNRIGFDRRDLERCLHACFFQVSSLRLRGDSRQF